MDDRTLSRRHCKVYAGPDGWRVTDLGSRNGTFLNGSPILDDLLKEGDRIELGETKIAVYLPGGEHAAGREREIEALLTRSLQPQARALLDRRREIRALTHLMELNEKINALRDEDEAEANATDFVLNKIMDSRRRQTLIARKEAGPVPRYVLDIHLQGDKETVFFDM